MKEVHHRLQAARQRAGFETATEAARRFGWNENTYRSHENGERGIKSKIAEKYADALKVDVGWLILGDNDISMSGVRLLSVRGSITAEGTVSANVTVFEDTPNAYYRVWIDFDVPDDVFTYHIGDNAMMPRYERGDLLLFWGESKTDMLKFPRFHQEGIAWDRDGTGHFGHVSHNGSSFTVQCIGAAPINGLDIERFDVVQAVVRSATYSGQVIVRNEDQS